MSDNPDYLRLSPSGISTFKQCPRKWQFSYIHGIKDPPNRAPLEGTFAHAIMETVLAEDPKDRTIDFAKEVAQEFWKDKDKIGKGYGDEYETLALETDEERAFKWEAWLGIKTAFELVNPPEIDVHSIEMDIEEEVFPNTWFKGFVDLLENVEGGTRITDWKLSKPPAKRFRTDKLTQLRLYGAVLWEKGYSQAKRTRLVFMRNEGEVIERPFTENTKNKTLQYFEEVAVDIRSSKASGVFEPETGPLCGWCYYLPACSEGQQWLMSMGRPPALNLYMDKESTPEDFKEHYFDL